MPDLRGLLAAIGGGAESLGSDIGQRDQLALVRQRQATLDAQNKALQDAQIANYQSLEQDRKARQEDDPVVGAGIPVSDGTIAFKHKSGKISRYDANGNLVNPSPPIGPTVGPGPGLPASPKLSVDQNDLTSQMRSQLGWRQLMSPDIAASSTPGTVPQPSLSSIAPAFGKPGVTPRIDPLSDPGIAARKTIQANAASLRPGPAPDRALVKTVAPDGSIVWTSRAAAAGKGAPQSGGLAGGMGMGGIGGVARTSAAITGMAQAEPLMTAFENDPQRQLDGLDYWEKMKSSMYDAKGVVDPAIHATVYSHLNQVNPKLANYLRNAETWALEDSQLSGKASDFRLKLDAFISQIGPNADPTQIHNTQNFRKTRLAELQRFQPAMQAISDRIAGGGRGGANSNPDNHPGPVNLGGSQAPTSPEAAWAAKNPPAKGESFEAYHARYLKSIGGGGDE